MMIKTGFILQQSILFYELDQLQVSIFKWKSLNKHQNCTRLIL